MRLRKLKIEDASRMLEWMHDDSVVHYMGTNFAEKSIDDCQTFIRGSMDSKADMHLAIVDDTDSYMGTVSLKHIDKESKSAEFAITVCKDAMGKGYSTFGMKEILRIGLDEIGLESIYWCVSSENVRAVRFYDKNGYARTKKVPKEAEKHYTDEQMKNFIWYNK